MNDVNRANGRRSGEYPAPVDFEIMQKLAKDAASAAVNELLLARSKEDGHRDAILQSVVQEIKQMREDIRPRIESCISHGHRIEEHEKQLGALWNYRESESNRIAAKAAEVAKSIIHEEIVTAAKQTRSNWAGVIPAVVGSVLSSILTAVMITAFLPKEKEETPKDKDKKEIPDALATPG